MKNNNTKYGIRSLDKQFPTDEACLDYVFSTLHSHACSCGGTYKLIKGRKQYQCSKCRFQIAPTAGTIFHKSDTPLRSWFHAILVFSNAKSGISAKQLQRELEVTYKCAWRMLSLIRQSLGQDKDKLRGVVEMDTGYVGGRFRSGKGNARQREAMQAKSVVMGAVQREGNMKAFVVPNNTTETIGAFLKMNVNPKDTVLMTDKGKVYKNVTSGYDRLSVNHGQGEYVRGDVHINNVETFWSHVKRSMKGTFKSVSKQHLQSYLDAFVFHYNNRHSDKERFEVLLGALLHASK